MRRVTDANLSTLSAPGDLGEQIGPKHRQPAPLEAQQAFTRPDLKLAVDHFARHADALAEFALRGGDRTTGLAARQSQERASQTAAQVHEHEFFDLFGRSSQPARQDFEQTDRDFGTALEYGYEISSFEHHEEAIDRGDGVRGVLPNGSPVIVDNNVTTAGLAGAVTGGTQDHVYVLDRNEAHLWEDPNAPVFIRAEQPAAASLGVLFVLYGYFAATFSRYIHAQLISGTGTVTPAFTGV